MTRFIQIAIFLTLTGGIGCGGVSSEVSSDTPTATLTIVRGQLEVTISEDFESGASETSYFLQTSEGETLRLSAVSGLKSVRPGEWISVLGLRNESDGSFLVVSIAPETGMPDFRSPERLSTSTANPVTGEQSILVVIANFSNASSSAPTFAQVTDVFQQTSLFYLENSYGDAWLRSDIQNLRGKHDLEITQTCDWKSIVAEGIKQAMNAKLDVRSFQNIVVIAPSACGWGGYASIGKMTMTVAPYGTFCMGMATVASSSVIQHTVSHEIGHLIGNVHSGFWNCGASSLESFGCAYEEYENYFTTMGKRLSGTWGFRHFNAREKERMGWLGNGRLAEVHSDGTYTVAPLEPPGNTVKVLKIARSSYRSMYVEFRKKWGYDGWLDQISSDIFLGALIHIDEIGWDEVAGDGDRTALIDASPSSSPLNPALKDGMQLTDQLTLTKITAMGTDASGAFKVKVENLHTDYQDPVIQMTSPIAGTEVGGVIQLSANVVSSLLPVEWVSFEVNGAKVGSEDYSAPYTFSLDTRRYPDGYVQIRALVMDGGYKGAYSPPIQVYVWNTSEVSTCANLLAKGVSYCRYEGKPVP